MHDTAKYLIHADITTNGVVERTDVVGAIFGQTEGLLGDELDLRGLQDASKVGRIDVDITSENGQSFGTITIATSLDQVETAILAAGLETIDRVGPSRSIIEVRSIEDVRAAKRRQVVDRAKELLTEKFDGSMLSSREIVEEVRQAIRIEDITEYAGLPAGPNVADSDAIIVVEGRADVQTLLRYGIKNAIAVEGTDVPEAVADLSEDRTVTAFLDADRGGELILKELTQIGEVDYVAFPPEGSAVEDLSRREVTTALREKLPVDQFIDRVDGPETPELNQVRREFETADESGATPLDPSESADTSATSMDSGDLDRTLSTPSDGTDTPGTQSVDGSEEPPVAEMGDVQDAARSTTADAYPQAPASPTDRSRSGETGPTTLRGHVKAVISADSEEVRFLDENYAAVKTGPAEDAFDLLEDADFVPATVILDGELTQRVLDIAAQRGTDQIVAASIGEFVKQPASVRIRTGDDLLTEEQPEAET